MLDPAPYIVPIPGQHIRPVIPVPIAALFQILRVVHAVQTQPIEVSLDALRGAGHCGFPVASAMGTIHRLPGPGIRVFAHLARVEPLHAEDQIVDAAVPHALFERPDADALQLAEELEDGAFAARGGGGGPQNRRDPVEEALVRDVAEAAADGVHLLCGESGR